MKTALPIVLLLALVGLSIVARQTATQPAPTASVAPTPTGVGPAEASTATPLVNDVRLGRAEVAPGENQTLAIRIPVSQLVVWSLSIQYAGEQKEYFSDTGNGQYDFTWTVPADTPPGEATYLLVGEDSGCGCAGSSRIGPYDGKFRVVAAGQ
ncbi:MAG: hypothetical protein HYY04_09690 [Chloroflexi bacterium]|nr:hypothetical protein [Chloroflexota bacterium]